MVAHPMCTFALDRKSQRYKEYDHCMLLKLETKPSRYRRNISCLAKACVYISQSVSVIVGMETILLWHLEYE